MECYVFGTQTAAESALNAIESRMKTALSNKGYTPYDGGLVVGKNAATGLDEPDKCRTERWDDPFKITRDEYVVADCRRRFPDDYETIESGLSLAREYRDMSRSIRMEGGNEFIWACENGDEIILE